MAGEAVASKDIPPILELYLWCDPSLSLEYVCWPRSGGFYDQDWVDMEYFRMIRSRIVSIRARKKAAKK